MFQLKNILDPEQLMNLYEEMHKVASIKMEGDDPEIYAERLNELSAWIATSGKDLADAKFHRNRAYKRGRENNGIDS